MKKILKLILLVCVVFSQISSPVKVIAEEIRAGVPDIEAITVTGNKDKEELNINIDGINFIEKTEEGTPVINRYIVTADTAITIITIKTIKTIFFFPFIFTPPPL